MHRDRPDTKSRAAAHAALLAVLLLALVLAAGSGIADMRRDKLKLITSTGEHTFTIEIADTPDEKARGLMFRRSLADDVGMLFPYEPPQEATMWMRNTYISLDMVFIRADGIVHRIEPGTEPFSERVIPSEGDVSAVLELKAGVANRIGLKAGDKAVNGLFKPAK
jgi:uncharacterized membrane protein (UPF0127 family)